MLVLLISFAILLAWLSNRYEQQFDWTRAGRHSLSSASQELLNKMRGPIEISAYASENPELRKIIKNIVHRYQKVKPDLHLQFVNPVAVPDEVRNLGISIDGELVLKYQGRIEHVKSDSEEEFTNSLSRLLRGTDRWLTFVEGHGERNPLGNANQDLGIWMNSLKQRGLLAQPLNLTQINTIPDNTSVLVITGPRVDYLPGEVEMIINYVENGGNLLWLTDPGELHGLETLAETLSIEFLPGTIIDYVGQLLGSNDPTITIASATNYQQHQTVKGFDLTTLFPALSAIIQKENESWEFQPIIISGEHTWSEHSELNTEIDYDQETDTIGPLNMAVSLTREVKSEDNNESLKQRIIIVGDGDFLSNQYLGNSGNLELGLRLINWLTHDDNFISIPAKTADDLYLELSNASKLIIIFGFLILLPLILLLTGLIIWWRRKKL